jgi:hypothetical protein
MNDHMNGAGPADLPGIDEQLPAEDPAIVQSRVEAQIDGQVLQHVGVLIRGLLVSSPQIPHALLLNSVARVTGQVLAMTVAGGSNTIEMTSAARADFKKSFGAGIAKIALLQPGDVDRAVRQTLKG